MRRADLFRRYAVNERVPVRVTRRLSCLLHVHDRALITDPRPLLHFNASAIAVTMARQPPHDTHIVGRTQQRARS